MSPIAPVIPEDVDAETGSTLSQLEVKLGRVPIRHSPEVVGVKRAYFWAARLDHLGMGLLRLGLVVVLLWIGGLKFASYEADGIVPLVANSPFGSFLYHHRPPEYRHYMNKEGEVVPANQQWQKSNGTYPVSYGLGVIIVGLGLLIALHPVLPQFSAVGSLLLIGMCFVTLSFLVTTPEAWVPVLGDVQPWLSFSVRCGATDNQGCDHARRRGHDTGGLSKGLCQTHSLILDRNRYVTASAFIESNLPTRRHNIRAARLLNVSDIAASFAWFEKLGWRKDAVP
jgi:uncharacterized membrane protein YkgB